MHSYIGRPLLRCVAVFGNLGKFFIMTSSFPAALSSDWALNSCSGVLGPIRNNAFRKPVQIITESQTRN